VSLSKTERIEAIIEKQIALMLDRAKIRRYKGSWDQEQKITEEIDKLEKEIKAIKAEQ